MSVFSRLQKKGLDKLIKAWNSVNNPEWKLDIIGYGIIAIIKNY